MPPVALAPGRERQLVDDAFRIVTCLLSGEPVNGTRVPRR